MRRNLLLMCGKKLLNPCCSELVTFLGITKIDEIRDVLKNIREKFGYTLKLIPGNYDHVNNPGITIEESKINVNRDVKVLAFGNYFIDQNNTNLDRALQERLISLEFYNNHKDDSIKLRQMVSFLSGKSIDEGQIIKLVLMDKSNSYVELQFQACAGYDETMGLSLQASESGAVNEYPLLGNVYMMNSDKYKYKTFGNATPANFESWLFVKNTRSQEELEKWEKEKYFEEVYIKDFKFQNDEK